jgi:hypothetical protein
VTARLAARPPGGTCAYAGRGGRCATATTENWAALYATAALARYGAADTDHLAPEQAAACERDADTALGRLL